MKHYGQMKNADWGSPDSIIEPARNFLGGTIDLDPCSSEFRNQTVGAKEWRGIEHINPLTGIPDQGWEDFESFFINPPGGKFGKVTLAKIFWRKMLSVVEKKPGVKFVWVAYNINQLQVLQGVSENFDWSKLYICVPNKRVAYLDGENIPSRETPAASAIIGYGGAFEEFKEAFRELGVCFAGQ